MDQDITELGEAVIARIVHERLEKDKGLHPGDRESVAYRIAEIMACAKELYTGALPRLLQEGSSMEEEISGLRMTFLHLRDLVTDFDQAFLEAMHHERAAHPEAVYDDWRGQSNGDDEEWTAEELGLVPEDLETDQV